MCRVPMRDGTILRADVYRPTGTGPRPVLVQRTPYDKRLTLYAATDGPSTDWVARLCDVDTHGVSRNITDGILRVTTSPDTVGEHVIDLWSTSNVFRAGHRHRVQVTSSSFPRWDRNPNTGESPQTA